MDKKSRELVMAKLYFKNKDYKMAEKSFNEYLEMNPTDANATKLLAQVYEQSKRFDKAFEMYERCYLAEPDRTGVLLDICRILLMNEIWLEHVDYRKWLNLAIKAFPSNPIVVNLKACLTTLPPGDQKAVLREEDPLERIFEKLCSMESRLEKIEEKLKNQAPMMEASAILAPKAQSPINFAPKLDPPKQSSPQIPTPQLPTPQLEPPKQEQPKSLFGNGAGFSFSSKLFENSLQKPNLPTGTLWGSSNIANFSFSQPKEETKSNGGDSASKSETLPISPPSAQSHIDSTPRQDPPKSVFGSTAGFNFSSSNLFESGLQKFNLPMEGSWANSTNTNLSFSKPKEDDKTNEDGGEGDELAPNEELAIENTCDMEPIEIKTGEENEDLLFEHRCKLFRFRDKEYKERGLGSIKVLKHKSTGKGRLIMRREAIGLVCLNCWDCNKVERMRDTQVRWIGLDASDGDPEPTVFLVKFKTQELTDTFMSHLTALFSEDSSPNTSVSSPQAGKAPGSKLDSNEPEVELVDPKLNPFLVDKARQLQLPDLFYHKLKNQEPCAGCDGCDE